MNNITKTPTYNCSACGEYVEAIDIIYRGDKPLICKLCYEKVSEQKPHDPVNYPAHYTSHPSGVECITITQHMNFCIGNAVKYLWRAGLKNNQLEDLKKARWYIDCEIKRIEK